MAYQAPCWLLYPFRPAYRAECIEENTQRLLEGKKEVQTTVAEERTERVEAGGGFWQNLDDIIGATGEAIGAAAGTTPFAGLFDSETVIYETQDQNPLDYDLVLIGGAALAGLLILRG